MNREYDMRICKCGRIHMIPDEKVEKALEDNKNLLLICAGCGSATLIGADIEPDWDEPDKDCYMMYASDFSSYKDISIHASDFDKTKIQRGLRKSITVME